ncbi:MAG: thioredoxin [Lysobacterales bacterium CG17_big_fil_post_rev_8_21_14_2_50_64_11]|nr:MAG: thioredoxin [Xanthomonadales bacterium CG17_big_fil_post_rev_8_21_14_2_50_64_11]PIX60656.1 MAG: TlpA family protein disulfide reductase [Xanthomonadales bacterium CG_4_10_14_3_um_filter_64_11]
MTRLIISGLLAVAGMVSSTSAARAEAAAEAPGFRPTLTVQTVDGQPFELSAHRGKWVVVNFWATWCAPCLKEMPDFSAFDQARDDVQVIGLAYEEIDAEDMRAFLAKHPVSYPVSIVDLMAPPPDFDPPRGLPLTYLVAPDGRIAQRFMGPVSSELLTETIAKVGAMLSAGGAP